MPDDCPPARATAGSAGAVPLGTGTTYRGRLQDSAGKPISDNCDLAFSLWPAASGGDQIGGNCSVRGVAVSDGYFTVIVNVGGQFGPSAFLAIHAGCRWTSSAVQTPALPH